MKKLSFAEIVEKFTKKFGEDWCNEEAEAETVMDTFLDYSKSMCSEQFDAEKVGNLK